MEHWASCTLGQVLKRGSKQKAGGRGCREAHAGKRLTCSPGPSVMDLLSKEQGGDRGGQVGAVLSLGRGDGRETLEWQQMKTKNKK